MKFYSIEELQVSEQIQELNKKGVYIIKCLATKEEYIGSTSRDFRIRWRELRKHLRANSRKVSKLLREYWHKYGEENFVFGVLEITNDTIKQEQYWINKLNPSLNQKVKVDSYKKADKDWKFKVRGSVGKEEYKKVINKKRQEIVKELKNKLEKAYTRSLKEDTKVTWELKFDKLEFKFSNLSEFLRDNDIDKNYLRLDNKWLTEYGIYLKKKNKD